MYVVANRIPLARDWQETFEERFRARAQRIDKQPGFVRMEVLRPDPEDGGEEGMHIVLTHWQDKQSFENWVGSEDFREAHSDPLPKEAYREEGGSIERHEVVVSTDD